MKTVEELVAFSAKVDGQGTEDHQNCTYTKAELTAIAKPLIDLPHGSRVVEIGVYCGRSASLYLQVQEQLNLDIHLIDNWSWAQSLAAHSFVDLVLQKFNETPFTLHKMLSRYLGECHWQLPINLLHIDGWHDMDGIEPDCILWLPWVKPGGYVVFHDSESPAVKTCIDKYVNSGGYTIMDMAYRTTVWRKHSA